MPLHSPRELFRRMIERLYQPVGGICHGAKLKRKITNPLVMIAVYLERGGFEHCAQRSIGHQRNLMPIPIIRTFHAVRNCRRHLRGDVLIQRSPPNAALMNWAPRHIPSSGTSLFNASESKAYSSSSRLGHNSPQAGSGPSSYREGSTSLPPVNKMPSHSSAIRAASEGENGRITGSAPQTERASR